MDTPHRRGHPRKVPLSKAKAIRTTVNPIPSFADYAIAQNNDLQRFRGVGATKRRYQCHRRRKGISIIATYDERTARSINTHFLLSAPQTDIFEALWFAMAEQGAPDVKSSRCLIVRLNRRCPSRHNI